jgi:thymidylate kinase
LFLADRADLQRTVRAHLAKSETSVVVSDRCYWSSLVYQQDHYDMAYLKAVHDTPNLIAPSHILFLDVMADIAVERALKRTGKVVEIFDTEACIHKNAKRYRALAMDKHPSLIGCIKADNKPADVLSACLLWLQSAWAFRGTHAAIARAASFLAIPPRVYQQLSIAA